MAFNIEMLRYFANKMWRKNKDTFVSKETGKSLSTNDYTNEDKNKLDNLSAGTTTYSNTASGLTSTNVQGAIDEINTELLNKSDSSHTHDDRYYTETEIDTKLSTKSDSTHTHDSIYYTKSETYTKSEINNSLSEKSDTSHTHDDRYYTETEIDTKLATKSDTSHNHDSSYYTKTEIDSKLSDLPTNAESTTYSNTTSGLTSTNVQGAIDELKDDIDNGNIVANSLNIDKINANNGLNGLKLAGFTVNETSLYNQKPSVTSNDVGCYIGTDGIAYSGTERHFKVNSSGDVVSDAIYSSDGVQLLCHNTSYTSNPNGNVVLAYGNANETNLYGNEIRLIPSPNETDYDYRILIQKGLIAPYLDSTYNLGNATHKWSKIYCDELICTTVTSENGGSSSGGGSGGVSSGDTVSNITITGQNNFLKNGNLYLGNAGSIIETYYLNSDGNAKFNLCNIVDLNVTGSATLPTLSKVTITGQNNYLKDGNLYLGTSSTNYYINSDGNAKFNSCNIVDLNVTGSATLPTLSKVTITGQNNYLKDGNLYLGTSSFNYYLNSDGNGSFNSCNIVDLNVTGSATLPTLSKVTITGQNNYLKDGNLYLGTSSFNYYLNSDGNGSFVNLYYNTLTQNSSKRFKENINYKDNTYWHDKLMGIKPCTFNYKNNEKERIGVIAEDLYETFPELVQKDSDGLVSSVSYVDMIIPLVSEVQRLNNEINEIKSLIS